MEKIQDMFGQINNNMKAMDKKLTQVVNELGDLKLENKKLKEKIGRQDEKISSLERDVRRKNIIIRGLDDKDREGEEETKTKVLKVMDKIGVKIHPEYDIDEMKRMGRPKSGYRRPIILKLTRGDKKAEILKGSNKLKGTDIWIDEDYPRDIVEARKMLYPRLREARQRGEKAVIRYDKLIVNDEVYEVDGREIEENDGENSEDRKRKVDERSPEAKLLSQRTKKSTVTKN